MKILTLLQGSFCFGAIVILQELADMYDKLHHTKMMGIEYTANTILGMHAGLSAEAQGSVVSAFYSARLL